MPDLNELKNHSTNSQQQLADHSMNRLKPKIINQIVVTQLVQAIAMLNAQAPLFE